MDKKQVSHGNKVTQIKANPSKRQYIFFGLFDVRDRSLLPLQFIALAIAIYEAFWGFKYIFAPDSEEYSHTFAHLGSYTLAYSTALFVVAFKPARSKGLLILFVAATIGFLTTSIVDIIRGNAGLATEVSHITKLVPPFIVWIISKRVVLQVKPPSKNI